MISAINDSVDATITSNDYKKEEVIDCPCQQTSDGKEAMITEKYKVSGSVQCPKIWFEVETTARLMGRGLS